MTRQLMIAVIAAWTFNMRSVNAADMSLCALSTIEDGKGVLSGYVWDASAICWNAGVVRGWEKNHLDHTYKTLARISLQDVNQDHYRLAVNIEKFAYYPKKIVYDWSTNFICVSTCSNGISACSKSSAFGIPMPTELLGIVANTSEHLNCHLVETGDFDVQNISRKIDGFEGVVLKRSIFISRLGIFFLAFSCEGVTIPCGNNQLCIWVFRIVERGKAPPVIEMAGLLNNNSALYTDANINKDGDVAVYCGIDGFQCKTITTLQSLLSYLKTIRDVSMVSSKDSAH